MFVLSLVKKHYRLQFYMVSECVDVYRFDSLDFLGCFHTYRSLFCSK